MFAPLTLLLVTFIASSALADSAQIVNLGYATYQGTFNATANITNFLGIRYAAPPVGKLRFQAPQPPLVQNGIQLANVQPPACPQAGIGTLPTNPARGLGLRKRQDSNTSIEDCLFMNVHVSGVVNPNARFPVVFFIHGGGYVEGSTAGLSGADLIREGGGGIVAVEIQYRLGVFGFLPGQEVKDKGALNAGLLDQQAALQWVQKFIHLFGGDPSRVTIWGESAGAGSVLMHLVAHEGNTQPPLFHQAMTSSLPIPNQYVFNAPVPEFLFARTVNLTGCSNATDAFVCLVETDASTLEEANSAINANGFFGTFLFVPVVDGEFVVERPLLTVERGKLNAHTLLAVTNTFEGTIFVSANIAADSTVAQYAAQIMPQFTAAQIQETVNLYTGVGFNTTLDQVVAIVSEAIFVCPTHVMMSAFPGRVHKAEFAIPPGTHGSDIVYYFPGNSTPPFSNPAFDASFAGAFMGVVKSGDPNAHPVSDIITPEWPVFSADNPVEMLFNRTEDFQPDIRRITTDPGVLERCKLWKSLEPFIPQ